MFGNPKCSQLTDFFKVYITFLQAQILISMLGMSPAGAIAKLFNALTRQTFCKHSAMAVMGSCVNCVRL